MNVDDESANSENKWREMKIEASREEKKHSIEEWCESERHVESQAVRIMTTELNFSARSVNHFSPHRL